MKSTKKFRIVLDTNVWLSGLVFGGQPQTIIEMFVDNSTQVITSEELLSELRRVIYQKFPLFCPKLALLEASIRENAEIVALGKLKITVSRDLDDNRVIETALAGGCSYIVSGDNDLLVLKEYQGISILKPAEFLIL